MKLNKKLLKLHFPNTKIIEKKYPERWAVRQYIESLDTVAMLNILAEPNKLNICSPRFNKRKVLEIFEFAIKFQA